MRGRRHRAPAIPRQRPPSPRYTLTREIWRERVEQHEPRGKDRQLRRQPEVVHQLCRVLLVREERPHEYRPHRRVDDGLAGDARHEEPDTAPQVGQMPEQNRDEQIEVHLDRDGPAAGHDAVDHGRAPPVGEAGRREHVGPSDAVGRPVLRAGAVPPHVEQHGEPERRRDSEHAAQEVVERRPAFRPRSLAERREQGERARDEEEVHPVAAEVRRCIDERRQARHALARVTSNTPSRAIPRRESTNPKCAASSTAVFPVSRSTPRSPCTEGSTTSCRGGMRRSSMHVPANRRSRAGCSRRDRR